jgi:hypothetical protein
VENEGKFAGLAYKYHSDIGKDQRLLCSTTVQLLRWKGVECRLEVESLPVNKDIYALKARLSDMKNAASRLQGKCYSLTDGHISSLYVSNLV